MKTNNRLNSIPKYHFKKMEELKSELLKEGKKIVDLSIGDPDLLVNKNITDALIESLSENRFNNYPPYEGIKDLKLQVIKYYDEQYSVKLNLDEVIILIGSKEGLSGIIPAVCDVGDTVIVPEVGYPVYEACAKIWGCNTFNVPITEKNSYFPELLNIPESILRESKLFFINYPNNPTGATGNESFFKEIISFCDRYNIILCNDGAYNEIIEPEAKNISLLQFDFEKQCVEFGSFSKTYNMTGFRLGYAVGNKSIISALSKVKSNLDSGQFLPIQKSGIAALKLDRNYVNSIRTIYSERKLLAINLLKEKNIECFSGAGTFYLWCKIPKNYTTDEFCSELVNDYGIVVTPGYCFGSFGYGYFRIALTKDKEVIVDSLSKLKTY